MGRDGLYYQSGVQGMVVESAQNRLHLEHLTSRNRIFRYTSGFAGQIGRFSFNEPLSSDRTGSSENVSKKASKTVFRRISQYTVDRCDCPPSALKTVNRQYIQFLTLDPRFHRKRNFNPRNPILCLQLLYFPIPNLTAVSRTDPGIESQAQIVHLVTKGIPSGELRIVNEAASSGRLLVAVQQNEAALKRV